jgi:hypothetical protein
VEQQAVDRPLVADQGYRRVLGRDASYRTHERQRDKRRYFGHSAKSGRSSRRRWCLGFTGGQTHWRCQGTKGGRKTAAEPPSVPVGDELGARAGRASSPQASSLVMGAGSGA